MQERDPPYLQTSGAVLHVDKRIQINVQLEPIETLDVFKNVPNMLFPILWINEVSFGNKSLTGIKLPIA